MHVDAEALATLPPSGRVIREAHAVLMDGVRGQGKVPGEFRRTPVWIGPPGCGFFSYARDKGRLAESQSEADFWAAEREAVYEAWRRPLPSSGTSSA